MNKVLFLDIPSFVSNKKKKRLETIGKQETYKEMPLKWESLVVGVAALLVNLMRNYCVRHDQEDLS